MKPVFSVIIPAFNEEEVLAASYARLDAAMRGLGEPYELIFVNDGSRDNTPHLLRALASEHPEVRVLHFARNFGHQIAVTAGWTPRAATPSSSSIAICRTRLRLSRRWRRNGGRAMMWSTDGVSSAMARPSLKS